MVTMASSHMRPTSPWVLSDYLSETPDPSVLGQFRRGAVMRRLPGAGARKLRQRFPSGALQKIAGHDGIDGKRVQAGVALFIGAAKQRQRLLVLADFEIVLA